MKYLFMFATCCATVFLMAIATAKHKTHPDKFGKGAVFLTCLLGCIPVLNLYLTVATVFYLQCMYTANHKRGAGLWF